MKSSPTPRRRPEKGMQLDFWQVARQRPVPGSAPALGCRRVRPAPDVERFRTVDGGIFPVAPRGRVAVRPRRARSPGPSGAKSSENSPPLDTLASHRRDAPSPKIQKQGAFGMMHIILNFNFTK